MVLIQIIDGSAGNTWAFNYHRISFEHMILYSTIVGVSLIIQVFLLVTMTRIVRKIKKTSSRIALVIPYIYVVTQIIVIALACSSTNRTISDF